MAGTEIIPGDCLDSLSMLPDNCVQCVVTSPPYFGLRDYGKTGQIGLEPTPDAYVAKMVEVFREVRRVLREDGTLWLNLGDSYCSTDKWGGGKSGNSGKHTVSDDGGVPSWAVRQRKPAIEGVKPKDLVGIPWRVAFALQADGWYLRSDIIWSKPNPMPESVRDRCTKAHEYIFMLSKSQRYYYDADAVKEPAVQAGRVRADRMGGNKYVAGVKHSDGSVFTGSDTRNRRSVWTIATRPYKGAHFATFPPDLVEPCILAGSRPGAIVLDPFGGSGTTGMVANRHGRRAILLELNDEYCAMARARIAADARAQIGML